MNQAKAKKLVAAAKKIARKADSWVALSNALTDPHGGLIAQFFPEAEEKQEFLASPEYEQLNELLRKSIARTGLTPSPRGKRA